MHILIQSVNCTKFDSFNEAYNYTKTDFFSVSNWRYCRVKINKPHDRVLKWIRMQNQTLNSSELTLVSDWGVGGVESLESFES
jgi:hypothetical protein